MLEIERPELAIFDLDGTLIEFHHDYLFSETKRILNLLGHREVEQQRLEEHFSNFDFFCFVEESRRERFIEEFWHNFNWKDFPKAKTLAGIHDTLEFLLENKVQIALATSRLVEVSQLRKELSHTGLLDFFSYIVTRRDETIEWSDKRGHLKEIFNHLKVEAKRALMVGDIPPDISSAEAVGVGTKVAVLSGGIKEERLAKEDPCLITADVQTLSDFLIFK